MFRKFLQSTIVKKIMSWFIGAEGITHIVLSSLAFYGLIAEHVYNWIIWLAPSFDFLMGFGGVLTGIVLHFTTIPKQNREEDTTNE